MICRAKDARPRVTVEDAKRAFEVTGLRPLECGGAFGSTRACVLQALHAEAMDAACDGFYATWAKGVFGNAYASGVMHGWDYGERCGLTGDTEIDRGIVDGRACRRAILESQPEPVCIERMNLPACVG